jgi:hypothetical protein
MVELAYLPATTNGSCRVTYRSTAPACLLFWSVQR